MPFLEWILYYFHLSVVHVFTSSLSSFAFINTLASSIIRDGINESYDYVIVGGGSAGAILALRLSENKDVSVALFEAGTNAPDILNIPILGPLKQRSDFDWQYKTVPQKHSCYGLNNNVSLWPMGKVLGGSTHLNYMLYLKGNENDFVSWKDPESDEWSIEDIKMYFSKAEESSMNNCNQSFKCNKSGSILVRESSFTTDFSAAVLQAISEIGYKIINLNSDGSNGFMTPQVNIRRNGRRWTSEQKLKDVLPYRRNLKVLTNVIVEKVLLRSGYEAYGVNYKRYGESGTVFAKEEVILSAGTVGSPKILMLSGIGPENVLSNSNVRSNINLPVGRNVQDHITTGADLVLLNKTLFSMDSLTNPGSAYEYFVHGKGPYTSTMVDAVGVVKTDPRFETPDLEFMVMMAGVSTDKGLFSRYSLGISDKLWDEYFAPLTNLAAVSILPVVLHPKSVGEVELDPNDPAGPPVINPRYLTNEEDVYTLVRGIRIIQEIVNSRAMRDFGARFNKLPLPGCESFTFDSDEYWKCYVQHLTLTSYHPVGSCKMGVYGDSVVDYRLRVHKTNKLRVIDASVMPTMPSGNTNAAVVMLAEKGADIVKEDYYKRRSITAPQEVFFQNGIERRLEEECRRRGYQKKKPDLTWA